MLIFAERLKSIYKGIVNIHLSLSKERSVLDMEEIEIEKADESLHPLHNNIIWGLT